MVLGDNIFAGHGMKIESECFLILPNTKKSDIAKTAIELKKLNEIMLNKNFEAWKKIYEDFYGIQLEYTTEVNEENVNVL